MFDVLADEAGHAPDVPVHDVREVRNYVTAHEYGIARLGSLPLSLWMVRELHERLMRDVRGDHATPGEFRRSQNWIGPYGSTPANAPYVPPPPREMSEALGEWEKFLHVRGELPDPVQCAVPTSDRAWGRRYLALDVLRALEDSDEGAGVGEP
ncbi:Fic family protein [Arenimonas composti]|uniref:Fic family protein n=1 Tax=Arenimonas composti TaxID=370776 RepID=UPI001FE05792|nr:Fic family protein [Arenimonas composti]